MALTAAERQRKRREKLKNDPDKRADVLKKDRARWHARKTGIADLKDRDARKQRRQWRDEKRDYRRRIKRVNEVLANSPPSTPDTARGRQCQQGDRLRRANTRKLRNQLQQRDGQLKREKRKSDMYRKRWERIISSNPQSPRSKTMQLIRNIASHGARRNLLMHQVLVEQIKTKFNTTKQERLKQIYARLVTGKLVRKYRLQNAFQETFGFSSKRFKHQLDNGNGFIRKTVASKTVRYGQRIANFYGRDDVSQCTTGKKDTVTKKQQKQQRRLLCDTLKHLHIKFLAENPDVNISYTLFSSMRPFFVRFPTESDRQTCLCKLHENQRLMVSKLASLNVIDHSDVRALTESVCCDSSSFTCMHQQCDECKHSRIKRNDGVNINTDTTWLQWKTIKETRRIKEEDKQVSVTKKVEMAGTIYDLVEQCESMLERYKTHVFNINHQYQFYRSLLLKMQQTECLIHVDFSENYTSKLAQEIQSMHFGASKKQITLHTGVLHIGAGGKPLTFCSLSDDCDHGPFGIWTHLRPILEDIKKEHPAVNIIHFFSDGPCTQYRQKLNFLLFSNDLANRGIQLGKRI